MSIHTKMHGATHTTYTNYTVEVCTPCNYTRLIPMDTHGNTHDTYNYGPCAAVSIAQMCQDYTYEQVLTYIREYEPTACTPTTYGTCATTVNSIMESNGYTHHTSSSVLMLDDIKRTTTHDMVVSVQLPNGKYHITFVDSKGREHSTLDSRGARVIAWWN